MEKNLKHNFFLLFWLEIVQNSRNYIFRLKPIIKNEGKGVDQFTFLCAPILSKKEFLYRKSLKYTSSDSIFNANSEYDLGFYQKVKF